MLIHADRLLPVPALDIPENHLRQLTAMIFKQLLRIFKVGQFRVIGAVIILHIGDEVQRFRQFLSAAQRISGFLSEIMKKKLRALLFRATGSHGNRYPAIGKTDADRLAVRTMIVYGCFLLSGV